MKTLCIITMMAFTALLQAQYLDTVYELDPEQSIILWKGSYSFNFGEHMGIVKLEKGTLTTQNNRISGGEFTIDMTTIANDPNQDHKSPIKHLRDEDFFHVSKFPKATLKITSVNYIPEKNLHEIIADLTIKEITKSQTFYATADGDTKTLTTKLKIDRTRWGIIYNHKLKDKAISDAIEFDVRLVFK